MYKDFYEKEIKEISKMLEEENIHIVEIWTNFQKYIYDISDERNLCTDLVLTLDQNPKYMKVITLEKIEDYMKFSPLKPGFFSLQYKDDNRITEQIDFDFYEYDPGNSLVAIRTAYKKTEDYENFDMEIDKDNAPYSKAIMIYVNNILEDLENEFDVDLSSEKFDLTYKEKVLRKSWAETYKSPIFGEYDLKFKIYEESNKFSIGIENSFTNEIYRIEDEFSSYNAALEWAEYIANDLVPVNNKCLSEKLQQRIFSCEKTIYQKL